MGLYVLEFYFGLRLLCYNMSIKRHKGFKMLGKILFVSSLIVFWYAGLVVPFVGLVILKVVEFIWDQNMLEKVKNTPSFELAVIVGNKNAILNMPTNNNVTRSITLILVGIYAYAFYELVKILF